MFSPCRIERWNNVRHSWEVMIQIYAFLRHVSFFPSLQLLFSTNYDVWGTKLFIQMICIINLHCGVYSCLLVTRSSCGHKVWIPNHHNLILRASILSSNSCVLFDYVWQLYHLCTAVVIETQRWHNFLSWTNLHDLLPLRFGSPKCEIVVMQLWRSVKIEL